jgi:hypothetical protein
MGHLLLLGEEGEEKEEYGFNAETQGSLPWTSPLAGWAGKPERGIMTRRRGDAEIGAESDKGKHKTNAETAEGRGHRFGASGFAETSSKARGVARHAR